MIRRSRHAQGRALRLDHLAVRDDLLLDVREVADDVLGRAGEHLVLDPVELVPDLVEDREAVVEQVVEHLVEQAAGALCEELLAVGVVRLAAGEQPRDREQLARREGDEIVLADEDVELGGVEPLHGLVEDREVEDGEEVLRRPRSRRPSAAGASRRCPRRRADASRSARRASAPSRGRARRR